MFNSIASAVKLNNNKVALCDTFCFVLLLNIIAKSLMVGGGKSLCIKEFFVKTIFFIIEAILYVMQDSNI